MRRGPLGHPRATGRCSGSEDRERTVRHLKGLSALATLSLGVVLLAGCSEQDEPPRVRSWALAPPEGLGQKIGRPVHLILRRAFSEVNDLVRSREAEVAQLCSRGFLQGHADFGLTALAVPVVNRRTRRPSHVIVSAESEIGTPAELTGKTVAFVPPH